MSDPRRRSPDGPPTTTTLAALGKAAGEVAHDIANALSAIVMHASLIRSEAASPSAASHAEAILRAARAANEIVERVRSRLRQGERRPRALIDLAHLVEDALVAARVRATARGVTIAVVGQAPAPVAGQRAELLQLVMNLLNNAVDASAPGHEVVLELGGDDDEVTLAITDRGAGIPPALIERVFEPFFTTKGERGTGLGLSLARSIAESHGGALELGSRLHGPERGTTARVVLPSADPDDPELAPPRPPTALEIQGVATGARVLIIDDDPNVREAMLELMTATGFQPTVAADLPSALAALGEGEPEVIITDLHLGATSGVDLVRAVGRTHPDLPIIVVSGSTVELDDDTLAYVAARFDKPVSPQRLIARTRELVAEARGRRFQRQ